MANQILPCISSLIDHEGTEYLPLSENLSDRDYQQERLKKVIWLAAMLECEGTFTFRYNEQVKNGGLHSHIQPAVIFINTDYKLVEKLKDNLVELGYTFYERKPYICGMGKKPKHEIQINGFKSLPLLKEIYSLVVGEKQEAVRCLIDFIEFRKSLKRSKQPYSEIEFGLLRRVREINSGHWRFQPKFSSLSSTTVRQRRLATWKAEDAKIQSGLRGDTQNAAEMTASLDNRKKAHRKVIYPDLYQE